MLSVAALAEVLAYYAPGVDNLLDSLATPAALIAGTVVSAAVMTRSPHSRWSSCFYGLPYVCSGSYFEECVRRTVKKDADLSVYRHLCSTEGTIQAEKSRPNIQE